MPELQYRRLRALAKPNTNEACRFWLVFSCTLVPLRLHTMGTEFSCSGNRILPHPNTCPNDRSREREMEPFEIQAKASIAAALIMSRAVEVPSFQKGDDWSKDTAALRLRNLTDYVYQMITSPKSR